MTELIYPSLSYSLITPPALEPVSVSEVKVFSRIDHDVDDIEDAELASWITGARRLAEKIANKAFIAQTWRMEFDAWPCGDDFICFPRPPLIDIESFVQIASDGTETEISSDYYFLDTLAQPGRLYLNEGASLTTGRYARGLGVEWNAGFGEAAEDVPEEYRIAIKMWVNEAYNARALPVKPSDAVLALLRVGKVRGL